MIFDIDELMRAAFVIQFLGVPLVRSMFAGLKIGEAKGRRWRESATYVIGGIPIAIGLFFTLYAYLFSSDRAWMYLGLTDVVRWTGLAASLPVCGFLIWVFKTIGMAGAKHLVTFDEMKLATKGPYSRIRHPMYVGFGLWGCTLLLFTDNWALGGSLVVLIVFVGIFRVPHEEKVLIKHFGDDYRRYMARTGRFLPFAPGKSPLADRDFRLDL